ncbi:MULTISPECIES: hypothetical protein [Microbacterium]|uniref:hypothetical protein n=1 Tax=Microbacterium TaxID=33882 RepID=UPI00131A08C3|nr:MULTISPECIES: hypothetical protein [Microbacterium]
MGRGNLKATRTHFEIDGQNFLVSDEHDVVELMYRIEAAARTEPTFIDIATTSSIISVLITANTRVLVYIERGDDSPIVADDELPYFDWDI